MSFASSARWRARRSAESLRLIRLSFPRGGHVDVNASEGEAGPAPATALSGARRAAASGVCGGVSRGVTATSARRTSPSDHGERFARGSPTAVGDVRAGEAVRAGESGERGGEVTGG